MDPEGSEGGGGSIERPTGIPTPVLEVALGRQSYGAAPLSAEAAKSQQTVADTFFALGLLPKPVTVAEAVWRAGS